MTQRYFVESPIAGETATLTEAEAHHLAHVMRASAGDEVTLFDGSGAEFAARVKKVGRAEIAFEVLARHEICRESSVRVVLGVALPKGDRQRWLIEKAVELGVACVVPLLTVRGVAQPVENALARLQRSVIEAAKQCGRNVLMEIAEPQKTGEFFTSAAADSIKWIAHPDGEKIASLASAVPTESSANNAGEQGRAEVYLAIGPEGGFTDDEIASAREAGWQAVALGARILRTETAAVALAGWWTLLKG